MTNIKQTIGLDNDERDLKFANQYATVENGLITDVYVLIGDKYEVSIMRKYERDPIFNQFINNRVRFVQEVQEDLAAQAYDEMCGEGEGCEHSDAMQYSEPANVFEGL